MATIRKRINENFVSYEVQVRKKGQSTQTKTFRNRADAEKWGRLIETEIDRGVFVDRSEAESTSLADALWTSPALLDDYQVPICSFSNSIGLS